MIDINTFREIAMSLPEVTEEPHFEKTSFRVRSKIFATLDIGKKLGCVKLGTADQDLFSQADKLAIHAVPNKWGSLGWSLVDLRRVRKSVFRELMIQAYCEVAPVKLRKQIIHSLPDKPGTNE